MSANVEFREDGLGQGVESPISTGSFGETYIDRQRFPKSMKGTLIVSGAIAVEVITLFVLLAPVIYVPTIPVNPLNGGLGERYISISCQFFREGAVYFPGGPYQLISNPFEPIGLGPCV
jgi:hypothetical protein